jgi:hypothetical protein
MNHKRSMLGYVLAIGIVLVSAMSNAAFADSLTIDFNGLPGADGSPFTNYTEFGFTVSAASGNWLVGKNYGDPPPFIWFNAPAGSTITSSIAVADGGATFSFNSIDLYSSVTTIPYTFTGLLSHNAVFTVSGIVPLTFGNFALVLNPDSAAPIDTLEVTLTDSVPCCGSNPVGLDNISVATSVPEPAYLWMVAAGLGGLILTWRRVPRSTTAGS